ncbi:MAG TPA: heavy metal translocating P-type ATPase, partial [Candidatus Acidoferrales bacterium]|nr:heavy metal translocating P-type ATPase [Candidatus Acidoferrales bacterium]
ALEIRVERLGRDTTFGQIVEAVERAEASRAPIQGIADRLAGYLVYLALAAAAVTLFFTHNMRSTISVVIVAGACGIAAGTPLAILGAIGRSAQNGAIIKGGRYLEGLAAADTIVLDKTGTLTYGVPAIEELRPANGVSAEALIEAAATAECRSEHPVAKAILGRATEMKLQVRHPEEFEYTPGRGVVARIDGEEITVGSWQRDGNLGGNGAGSRIPCEDGAVLVTRGGHLLGSIRVADQLRPEARAAIEKLRAMGLKTILLTGDSRRVAEETGNWLGVDEIFAELMPEQKLEQIEALLAQRRIVVMVGDGINDAPALTRATVGVAMGSGTDVARESSDVVLIGSDLLNFAETVRVARWCRRIIMQNFAGTLIVDSVGVGLAAAGILNPLLAAFIHVSSELAFILNSTRLLPRRREAYR